ncbi:DUF397 domain-containing protein [Streptomyces lydicus]|uniref:DUF397 domain-containing protein n=1 Tax=Streptomyces lydicus TaxID=47763 RepID=UPI003681F742
MGEAFSSHSGVLRSVELLVILMLSILPGTLFRGTPVAVVAVYDFTRSHHSCKLQGDAKTGGSGSARGRRRPIAAGRRQEGGFTMVGVHNGMAAGSVPGAEWVKASVCDAKNSCVEVARVGENEVAMQNSRFPDGPALVFTRDEIVAFFGGVLKGDFDSMTV